MPDWKYKKPKVFPIDNLPVRGYWIMKHTHNIAMLTRMADRGITVPIDPIPIKLEVRYGDQKDLEQHGVVEKEYKCLDCGEVETYQFRLRRYGESRVAVIHEVIEAKKDAN